MNAASENLPMANSTLPRAIFAVTLVLAAACSVFVFYQLKGSEGLVASLVGIGFGALLCGLTWAMSRLHIGGGGNNPDSKHMMVGVLLSSFTSMLLFVTAMIAVALFWKSGLVPATISALVVYMMFKFYLVFRGLQRTRKDRSQEA